MKKEILLMTTGIFVGTLLCHGGGSAAAGAVAEPSWQPIFVNGEQVQMEAYNIHGNNFVKLRDIGQAVGFNVYWQDGVQVDSASPYTGTAPLQETSVSPTTQELRQEMVRLINQVRREHGAAALAVDQSLMDAAQECSAYLYTKHNNRVECETVAASGYPHGFGSNLTVFSITDPERISEKAVANWGNSSGHLATMIDPDSDTVGVGITVSNGRAFCYMFVGKPGTYNPYA